MHFLKHTDPPSTNRGATVWQRNLPLSPSRSLTIFPHLGLWHSPPLLITHAAPQTSLSLDTPLFLTPSSLPLALPSLQTPLLHNLSFSCSSHTLTPFPALHHHLPFSPIPGYFSCPCSLLGTPSQRPIPTLYLCCNSIPVAASASCLTLAV